MCVLSPENQKSLSAVSIETLKAKLISDSGSFSIPQFSPEGLLTVILLHDLGSRNLQGTWRYNKETTVSQLPAIRLTPLLPLSSLPLLRFASYRFLSPIILHWPCLSHSCSFHSAFCFTSHQLSIFLPVVSFCLYVSVYVMLWMELLKMLSLSC